MDENNDIKGKENYRFWQYLTHSDFKKIDPAKTIVAVTCSPIEVHGPHLPVITDNRESEAILEGLIGLLAKTHPDICILRLPPLYVATDVLPKTGSLQFKASTIIRVLSDLGRTLAKQGFKRIWISSFHGGPRHFVALEKAAHDTNKKYGTQMVSLFSLIINHLTEGTVDASRLLENINGLSKELLKGDEHAGVIETSLMLHLLNSTVDPCYKELDRVTMNTKRIAQGKRPLQKKPDKSLLRAIPQMGSVLKTMLSYFHEETYAGIPKIANAEIGKEIIEVCIQKLEEPIKDLLAGTLPSEKIYSPLWPFRYIFLWHWPVSLFERMIGLKNPIF